MSDYTVVNIDEVDGAFGGALKRVRAACGASSFGMQVIDLPPDSGDLYPNHTHEAQEEVFVALRGSGELRIDDESVDLGPNTIVRVGPGLGRQIRSGAEGIRVLALGGTPGQAYEPPEWSAPGGPDPSPVAP